MPKKQKIPSYLVVFTDETFTQIKFVDEDSGQDIDARFVLDALAYDVARVDKDQEQVQVDQMSTSLPIIKSQTWKVVDAFKPKMGLRVDFVFNDWRKDNKSIYSTEEGLELSLGVFHSGTVFSGTIDLGPGDDEELIKALKDGYEPVFGVMLKESE